MTLSDDIKTDFATIFGNTDDFAETITYHFRGGGSRPIAVIVTRESVSFYEGDKNTTWSFTIEADNNCTTGVTASEMDTGGDEVELLLKKGDSVPVRRPVIKLLTQDEGALSFAVR